MTKKKNLAAILFADIVGYTKLMQDNELLASEMLLHFQETLQAQVTLFKGRVVNLYGDGALCIYNTPVDAVRCAIAMQHIFLSEPDIPVRIGIHSGTVTFEGDQAFGDSINLASRIESASLSGSILVSKKVRDEVRNQEDIVLEDVGLFRFKNVDEPMRLYAINHAGLTLPRKQKTGFTMKYKIATLTTVLLLVVAFWVLAGSKIKDRGGPLFPNMQRTETQKISNADRSKRVAVLPFKNQTMDGELEPFGVMAADWLTQGFMELEDVNITRLSNFDDRNSTYSLSELKQNQRVDLVIEGRYYLKEDQLIVHANLVDIETEIKHVFDMVQGHKEDAMRVLDNLTQHILGYWAVRAQKRYLRNPPKYDAYRKLVAAQEIFLNKDRKTEVEKLLTNAYLEDTTFYAPLLKLIVHYRNLSWHQASDSLIHYFETKNVDFTNWERLRFESIRASNRDNSNWLEAARLNEQLFELDPRDENANYNGAHFYQLANYPKKAVELLRKLEPHYNNKHYLRLTRELESLYMLGDYIGMIETIHGLNPPSNSLFVAQNHLRALVRLDSIDTLHKVFKEYESQRLEANPGTIAQPIDLLDYLCKELYLVDNEAVISEFVQLYDNLEPGESEDRNYYLGWSQFLQNNIKQALEYWELEDPGPVENFWYSETLSRKGVLYARLNRADKVQQMLEQIAEAGHPSGHSYCKARIYVALDQEEKAIALLRQSVRDGGRFYPWFFWSSDPFLKPIFDHPDFIELTRPKG